MRIAFWQSAYFFDTPRLRAAYLKVFFALFVKFIKYLCNCVVFLPRICYNKRSMRRIRTASKNSIKEIFL